MPDDERTAVCLVLADESDPYDSLDAVQRLDETSSDFWSLTNVGTEDGQLQVVLVASKGIDYDALIDRATAQLRTELPGLRIKAAHHGSRLPGVPTDLLAIHDGWARRQAREQEPPDPGMDPAVHSYLIGLVNYLDSSLQPPHEDGWQLARAYVSGALETMVRFGHVTEAQREEWSARMEAGPAGSTGS